MSAQSGSEESNPLPDTHEKCGSNQDWESVVMKTVVTRFLKDESGVTAIEYGLIAAFIGVGIIVSLGPLRDALNTMFNNVKTNVSR
jgi:pilus assembly protein Flp/PilA